jgi:hypothetical protein
MGTITKPNTFTTGTSIIASDHNANFDTIYNDFNGGITNVNIATTAGIVDSKLDTISTVGKVNLTAITVSGASTGNMIWASSTSTLASLTTGANGQVLKMYGSNTTLDMMEYASDALAQAAYVTDASYDSYTKFLAHFDGASGTTAYTAETGQVVTFVGNAQLDTVLKKFGTAAVIFDGSGDMLDVPDSADWDFGTSPFTVDFQGSTTDNTYGTSQTFVDIGSISSSKGVCIRYVPGGTPSLDVQLNGASVSNPAWTPTNNTLYHVAVARGGTDLMVFINGSQIGATVSDATNIDASTYGIGIGGQTNDDRYLKGSIDELRISKGIARYTANFTAPTAEYPKSLLAHSEATITTQGTYSLKGIAQQTDSLSKTLTRTIVSPVDLTGKNIAKFSIYSNRTGSNIKVGIHDAGGTTTETTPSITSASTWQTVSWDISAVATADKDAIDKIIFTVANADTANIFYVDKMFGEIPIGTPILKWVTP